MSALPFISHHLFASAVHNDGAREPAARKNDTAVPATDVPVEILDWNKPLPDRLARSMRSGPSANKT